VLIEPSDRTVNEFGPGDMVTFSVSDIRNPLSLEPTSSFKVYIATSTSQNYFVNQLVQGLSLVNMFAGQLSSVRVMPDTNEFHVTTDYSIYFVTTNLLTSKSIIHVTWPAEYFSFGNKVGCSAIKNIEKSVRCIALSPNVVEISNGFNLADIPGGTEIGIKLLKVVNPS
jgi:hypothetical protein